MATQKQSRWDKFNEQMKKHVKWLKFAEEILEIKFDTKSSGWGQWVKCHSVDGNDNNPSASYNKVTGYYKDFRDGGKAISSYDLMVQLGKAKDFRDARRQVASWAGVKWPETDEHDPEHGVVWKEWSDFEAQRYCNAKPPITIQGLKRAGARLCIRNGVSCIALPIIHRGGEIVGWMYMQVNGKPFQNTDAKSIAKVYEGVEHGLVCGGEVLGEMAEQSDSEIYWCEGAPDMLAGLSNDPDGLYVTNPNGCAQNVTNEQALFNSVCQPATREHTFVFIGDSDRPGMVNAWKRSQQANAMMSKVNDPRPVKCLIPYYEVQEKHGKDLRDLFAEFECDVTQVHDHLVPVTESKVAPWLNSRGEEFLRTTEEEVKDREEFKPEEHTETMKKEYKSASTHLNIAGIDVLYVTSQGHLKCHAPLTKSVRTVFSIGKTGYDDFISIAGPAFASYVKRTEKEAATSRGYGDLKCISFDRFKAYLGIVASQRPMKDCDICGAGVWRATDEDMLPSDNLVLVKSGEAYIVRDSVMTLIERPVLGKDLFDTSCTCNWFNVDDMSVMLAQAKDVEWRRGVYNELHDFFQNWKWGCEGMCDVAVGLMFATVIQSTLKWRPIVTLTGESNSGKTIFFKCLEQLYGRLSLGSAKSTASGILQAIGYNSSALLCDEFDNGVEQSKLLKLFRVSSRGQRILMGNTSHSGVRYEIRHIPWIMGIFAASNEQADNNRMISLTLNSMKDGETFKRLKEGDPRQMRDLGMKMMACIIATFKAASCNIERLHSMSAGGSLARYRESFAVPFGCLSAILGQDVDEAYINMEKYISENVVPQIEQENIPNDQERLLEDIMSSEVRLGSGAPEETATVAEILFDPRFDMHRNAARTKGIGFVVPKQEIDPKVAIATKRIVERKGLLKFSEWDSVKGLHQILLRLPENLKPKREYQSVAGVCSSCVTVSYPRLEEWVKNRNLLAAIAERRKDGTLGMSDKDRIDREIEAEAKRAEVVKSILRRSMKSNAQDVEDGVETLPGAENGVLG